MQARPLAAGEFRIPARSCRKCGYRAEAATNASGQTAPEAGDPNICLNCAHLTVFEDGGTVREPTAGELTGMLHDPKIAKIREQIRRRGPLPLAHQQHRMEDAAARVALTKTREDGIVNTAIGTALASLNGTDAGKDWKADGDLYAAVKDNVAGIASDMGAEFATGRDPFGRDPLLRAYYSDGSDKEERLKLQARLGMDLPNPDSIPENLPVEERLHLLRMHRDRLLHKSAWLDDVQSNITDFHERLKEITHAPSAHAARTMVEAMAQNLARNKGVSIEQARAEVRFLEDMREHVEGMKTVPAVKERVDHRIVWPTENAPRVTQLFDEEMPALPRFHISSAMEAELAEDDTWKFAESYAYWPPFPKFAMQIDPHADRLGLHVMHDPDGEEGGAFAFLPDSLYVTTTPEPYRERMTQADAQKIKRGHERMRERFPSIEYGSPGAESWMVAVRGRMFWYKNLPLPATNFAEAINNVQSVNLPNSPDEVGPSVTLLAFWNIGQPLMFPMEVPTDVSDFAVACMRNVIHRYVAVALNFVLLLNNRDTVRTRINQPTDGMSRQQRRAWERDTGKKAREEWQVSVKPKRANEGVGALILESAAIENVERKLPGRHWVRGHNRTYRSGKVVHIDPFEKCKDRPWAHLQNHDNPQYDAWSMKRD